MPTYEYECKDCGHDFEAFQNMSDEPLSVCPKCGGTLRRLIGAGAGIIFKGSGFYETDYKRKASKPAKEAEKSKPEGKAPGKTSDGASNSGKGE